MASRRQRRTKSRDRWGAVGIASILVIGIGIFFANQASDPLDEKIAQSKMVLKELPQLFLINRIHILPSK